MSTMLKTAAMSLLSKTLQTFLYKYLSDVDVEGVALPSVYDGSGWGVRLSNVKLREGVQLMEQMPGKHIMRKTRKRRNKKKKQKPPKEGYPAAAAVKEGKGGSHRYLDEEDLRAQESSFHSEGGGYGYDFPEDEPPQTPPRRRQEGNTASRPRDEDDELIDMSLHFNDVGNLRPTRSRTASTDDLEVPVDDHYDGGYGDDEGPVSSPTNRPSTPLQDSKSIFSCFTKGRKDLSQQGKGGAAMSSQAGDDNTAGTVPGGPGMVDDGGDDASSKAPVSVVEEKPMYRQVSVLAMDEKRDSSYRLDESSARTTTIGEEGEVDEESDSEDEFEDYEQPYRLCLGDNGRIGTLDIRLIGRELHVMVEDAVLTIEAFPVLESTPANSEGEEEGNPADAQVKVATDDVGSTVSGRTAPSTTAPVPPKPAAKVEPKRETVGDRVLADNPLARAIAAIPHLFLRDIRIRFIIRKEPQANNKKGEGEAPATTGTASTTTEELKSPPAETSVPTSNEALPGDTMLEIGIEFLSVSGGEDVLSNFQQGTEEESEHSQGDDASSKPPLSVVPTYSSVETPVDDNEYMVRHIRTGRGPAAGIWVQVFAPGPKLPASLGRPSGLEALQWARQQWVLATDFHLLRCSGLDVRARIHLGTKKQVAGSSWFYDYEEGEYEYDYYDNTLDSMVLGFDSIAPGPQLPLPPMIPQMSRGDTPRKSDGGSSGLVGNPIDEQESKQPPAMHPGSDKYTTDVNGIQSCKIPSSFHRISRGLVPGSCKDCTHLPSETCIMCWEGPATVKTESTLDMAMPMPGLALQITFRDPLEINVDRSSVETLHLLKTLFVKKREQPKADDAELSSDKKPGKNETPVSRASSTLDDTKSTASTSSFFGFLSSRAKEPEKEKDPSDAFALFMQPENIQVLGVHFSETILRVHVMREERRDDGLSFCYWDLLASCLTIDYQSLKSDEKVSQDLRFDVGYFRWNELRGVECKGLVSLGAPASARNGCESSNSVSTTKSLLDDHSHNKTPWPSAACALMDIPPPQETLYYKDREQHGIQLRFISLKNPLNLKEADRSMVNVRLGVTITKVPWGFWRDINEARKEVTWGILGRPDSLKDANGSTPEQRAEGGGSTATAAPSIMTYSVQVDGGSLVMNPLIDLSMPLTRFAGERSTEDGIFFEAILDKLQIAYGRTVVAKDEVLSLQQLASLPENVRSRILFCLDDLNPLEEALGLKKESNPFKGTRAVNKGILKMAKKLSKRSTNHITSRRLNSKRSPSQGSTRRQKIMTALMKLDNSELDELWAAHQRHQRKLAKKRAGVDHSAQPLGASS